MALTESEAKLVRNITRDAPTLVAFNNGKASDVFDIMARHNAIAESSGEDFHHTQVMVEMELWMLNLPDTTQILFTSYCSTHEVLHVQAEINPYNRIDLYGLLTDYIVYSIQFGGDQPPEKAEVIRFPVH